MAVSAVSVGACAGSDDDESAATVAKEAASAATAAPVPAEAADALVTGSGNGQASPAANADVASTPTRMLIVDVTVGLEVADVDASVSEVIGIGLAHQGQVHASDVDLRVEGAGRARVVLEVPPQEVEAIIDEIAATGRLVSRVQSTDDVTDQVTDLETRIASAERSVARLQTFLESAVDLGEVVALEGELTKRQTELEQLLAAQRNLAGQTALATLTVDLSVAPADAVEPVVEDEKMTVGSAFRAGVRGFVTAVTAVLIFIGLTAPFLGLVVAVGLIHLVVRRRRPAPDRWAPRSRSVAPPHPPAPVGDQRTTEHDSADAARR